MAVRHSGDLLSLGGSTLSKCVVCFKQLGDGRTLITPCNHKFHEECLMRYMQTSELCPQCETRINPNSLRFISSLAVGGSGRGSQASQRNLSLGQKSKRASGISNPPLDLNFPLNDAPFPNNNTQPVQQSENMLPFWLPNPNSGNFPATSQSNSGFTPSVPTSQTSNQNSQPTQTGNQGSQAPVRSESNSVPSGNPVPLFPPVSGNHNILSMSDIEKRIGEVVDRRVGSQLAQMQNCMEALTRKISQMANPRSEPDWPRDINWDDVFPNSNRNNTHPPRPNDNPNFGDPGRNSSQGSLNFFANSSKAAMLISSWHITFNGSPSGLPANKFIRMVNELARDNLRSDFRTLAEHSHLLFTGNALFWYWNYRLKNQNRIEWNALCAALSAHFTSHLSDYDILDLLKDRKQKANEHFDDFYYDILHLCDRLSSPLPEARLIDLLRKNLKPQLRKDLFFLTITSVAQLRQLILKRELLNAELESQNLKFPHKKVNSLEVPETDIAPIVADVSEISKKPPMPLVCWNCKQPNHKWTDCIESRNKFCYGCGAENVYKPQCKNCNKSEN